MPYWFDYDANLCILRGRLEGVIADAEMRRYHGSARSLLGRLQPRAAIMDMTEVTALDVSPATVQMLAASAPVVADPSVPRFVVAPAPSVYGIARMYQQLGQETRPNLTIVRSVDEVYAALGVAPPRFERVDEPAA
jgi:hypothetical protein